MCGRNNRKLLVVNDVVTVATSMFLVLSSLVTPPPILSVTAFAAPATTSSGGSFGGPSGSSISKKTHLRYAQEMEFDFTTAETCTTTGGPTARKATGVSINPNFHSTSTHDGLEKLRNCMVTSHHRSDDETYEVLSAIYAAADGDEQILSDVVELLTLLVQECEVGTDALIAAAFHYCSITSTSRTLQSLSLLPADSLVSAVVKNAEQLSRTEAIASSIYAGVASCKREARHQSAEYLRGLLLAETTNWRALVIRCAVHLFQLKKILNADHQYEATATTTTSANKIKNNRAANIRLQAKEAMEIYAPLASRLGMHRLKNEIEDTAFQILYRRQYEKVMSLYRRGEMEPILRRIKSKVEHVLEMNSSLQEYTSSMVVTSRVKEPFSLWKKMLRSDNRNNVHAVPDAIALRIILDAKPQLTPSSTPPENIEITRARERALCYYVQRVIIEECLPPASGTHHTRRKDYIARPKNNGYQSLHYTAAAEPYLLEVQVRSGEMHRVAEYGIAAHWDYKLNSRSSSSTTRASITFSRQIPVYGKTTKDSYLKSVQAWQLAQEEKRKKSCSEENKADVVLSEFLSASEKRAEDRVKPYLDALTTTKFDLEREQVLVFVSPTSTVDDVTTKTAEDLIPSHVHYAASGGNGQVISLPYGSCVLDALRAVGKPSGRRSPANCWHNGSLITSETQRLRNGDVLSMAMTP
jgi:ppGpp synthetase/RelA/SpoT-type nucleotidyltranferase